MRRWDSIQHRAPSLGLPHPKNSLQDVVLPPKQGAGVTIPSVGCTHVIWLKGNAPNTSQESLKQEKPHHCNSLSHPNSAATNTTALLGRGIYAPQAPSFPQAHHQESEYPAQKSRIQPPCEHKRLKDSTH